MMVRSRLHLKLAAPLLVMALGLLASSLFRQEVGAAGKDAITLDGRPLTPAGSLLLDKTTGKPAVGAMPMAFVRSPDTGGPNGAGRYLISVNSGYGVQFGARDKPAQSLSVIDLNANPAAVVQNVYFPSPQSVNVGAVFDPRLGSDGSYKLYVSGGFLNKILIMTFKPGEDKPLSPQPATSKERVTAPSIDLRSLAVERPDLAYNEGLPPVYPTGLALGAAGRRLFVANNLADNLGILTASDGGQWKLSAVDLHRDNKSEFIYPYGVTVLKSEDGKTTRKVYVSCWNTATVAVLNPDGPAKTLKHITVANHPTAMLLNNSGSRLYVVNSGADCVSVIDTATDTEVERVDTRLQEKIDVVGNSPESLALNADGMTLYVANSHSSSVAVVRLSSKARGAEVADADGRGDTSKVLGFVPTGYYPSALTVVDGTLFIANGKGTGFENSSTTVSNTGMSPNTPNAAFPPGRALTGQYILSLISGNISAVAIPDQGQLAAYTRQVMENNGMLEAQKKSLFDGPSPIKHIIYIIRENRSYDQVLGDIAKAGDGEPADGDPKLAIFGDGETARRPGGPEQKITPNAHALALRFGLLDRFFVNSEASPDGHNWSTAAFSSDYTDKAYRWNYSGRGRTYDFEGFDRLPELEPPHPLPRLLSGTITTEKIGDYLKRFVPYLNGSRDVAEPESLYLWDAAARAGLTYRNYGEFIATISADDLASLNAHKAKQYPDLSPNVSEVPTKKSLEGHFDPDFRNFDLYSPDTFTAQSYTAALQSGGKSDAVIDKAAPNSGFRGSRFSSWQAEFNGWVSTLNSGGGDKMPNLTVMRFPNDHTSGMNPGQPTPQFDVADSDYAVGRLVEAVSNSPYWKDTAIFVVEDDAQNGPDHVDAHRSPALVISAYNRPAALIHNYHTTVSLIRTMEVLLGMQPMNQLDAMANPIDIFQNKPDLRPYHATLPDVSPDNMIVPERHSGRIGYWIRETEKQDLVHEDMADPDVLNRAIWFSVRGETDSMPVARSLPVVDALRTGIPDRGDDKIANASSTRDAAGRTGRVTKRRDRDTDD